MIRHYIALITFTALSGLSFCAAPIYLWGYVALKMQVAGLASIGCIICGGVFLYAAEKASAKLIREKTRRNFIAG